jgi:hypothetical protein
LTRQARKDSIQFCRGLANGIDVVTARTMARRGPRHRAAARLAIGRLAVGSPGSDASTALIEQCCKSPTESDLLQSAKLFAILPP